MEQCKGACFTSSVLTARTTVRLQNTVVSLTCKMQTAGAAEEGLLENGKRMTRRLFILGADGSSLGTRKGAKNRAQECYHNAQANHRLGWKGLGLASITELQHNAPIVARPLKSSTRVLRYDRVESSVHGSFPPLFFPRKTHENNSQNQDPRWHGMRLAAAPPQGPSPF